MMNTVVRIRPQKRRSRREIAQRRGSRMFRCRERGHAARSEPPKRYPGQAQNTAHNECRSPAVDAEPGRRRSAGARIPPRLTPMELIPVPSASSCGWRYVALALPELGMPVASAMPSKVRQPSRPEKVRVNPVATDAKRPHDHGGAGSGVQTDSIDEHARERRHERVGDREDRLDSAVTRIIQMKFALERRCDGGQQLAIQIIDRGRKHDDPDRQPAQNGSPH